MIYLGNESSKLYLGDTLISQQNSTIKEYVSEVPKVMDQVCITDSVTSINFGHLIVNNINSYDMNTKILTGTFGGG